MHDSVVTFDLVRYHHTQKICSAHAPTQSNLFG